MTLKPNLRIALFLLALSAGGAHAQQVFRIVGPDGKVTFSDRAPETPGRAATVSSGSQASATAAAQQQLPYELRTVAQRFPVTLYTSPDCGPCGGARNLLVNRGVPFTEKTVTTASDADALKRISGDTSLPFGTIGTQFLKGFSDTEWTQFLDAAGYPRQSQLPTNYHAPAPTPLVAVQQAAPSRDIGGPAAAPAPRPPAPAPAPANNPTGIQF